MDRLILRCLPDAVRTRYADEIHELLARSRRPVRDRADLVVAAVGLRLGRLLRSWVLAMAVLVALSGVAVIHSITNLQGGAVEMLDHWWSTIAVVSAGTSALALTILLIARQRAVAWSGRPTD